MKLDLDNPNIGLWQIAAGDNNLSYGKYMLDWDVICIGPGRYGPWGSCSEKLMRESMSSRRVSTIKRLFSIPKGDIVTLRIGMKCILGVGIVADDCGENLWNDAFGDIDGWDLQHLRRVKWVWRHDQEGAFCENQEATWGSRAFKMGDSVQRLTSSEITEWFRKQEIEERKLTAPLKALPSGYDWKNDEYKNNLVSVEDIQAHLFDNGMSADQVARIGDEICGLIRLARWYDSCGHPPSEHETVAYLTVPLLKALGWTSQRMAIEWNRIDVALFDRLAREDMNLSVVIEAKKRWYSCLMAKSQGETYAVANKRKAERLVLTDGIRYAIYIRKDDRFPDTPEAYLNLNRLYKSYPVLGLECKGAADAIALMAYNWKHLAKEKEKPFEDKDI